jgi:hypothetical protein
LTLTRGASAILHHAGGLLADLGRRPRTLAIHAITATLCGLLMLPGPNDGYATLTIAGRAVEYTPDSVSALLGILFAALYPLAGAILLTTTLRQPVPDDLLASYPTRRIVPLAGTALAAAVLLLAHLLFLAAAGSLRGLGWSSLPLLPTLISTVLLIAGPALAATAFLVALVEAGPFARDRGARLAIGLLWLAWVAVLGLSLAAEVGPDFAGARLPLRQLLGPEAAGMSLGVVILPAETARAAVGDIVLPPSYAASQFVRAALWLAPILLAGLSLPRRHAARQRSVRPRRRPLPPPQGLAPIGTAAALAACFGQALRRLFRGRLLALASAGLFAASFAAPDLASRKLLYVSWGLYLVRWAEIGRPVGGADFAGLERSFPLPVPFHAAAAGAAIAAQMLLLAGGRLLAHPADTGPLLVQIAAISAAAIVLVRTTRSETPFLILGLVWWYAMLSL